MSVGKVLIVIRQFVQRVVQNICIVSLQILVNVISVGEEIIVM